MAFVIDNLQAILFDVKYGFCSGNVSRDERISCSILIECRYVVFQQAEMLLRL